jgi:acyl-CoA synthetase (AMP-forming)/AMP-acid ligase II
VNVKQEIRRFIQDILMFEVSEQNFGDDDSLMEMGAIGELVVRGAIVMKSYWELPEVAEAAVVVIPDPILGEAIK